MKRSYRLGAGLCTVALAACASSSRLVDTWVRPDYAGGPMRNMLVLVVRKDPARRRIWEDAFVSALAEKRVTATPSYHDFPDRPPREEEVRQEVEQGHYDGVLLARALGAEERRTYVRPGVAVYPAGRYWSGFYRGYVTVWRRVYRPGYVERTRVVSFETSVWSAEGLVWSGRSETTDPASAREFSEELSRLIVPAPAKARIVAGR